MPFIGFLLKAIGAATVVTAGYFGYRNFIRSDEEITGEAVQETADATVDAIKKETKDD